MIERGRPEISITRQCQLVQVSRSSVYYVAKPITSEELELRRRIDQIYLEHPFMGSRQIVRTLERNGEERLVCVRVECPELFHLDVMELQDGS